MLAEDHHVVRAAFAALLAKENDMRVVGEVADGADLVATVKRLKPDILLMDAQMPNHKPIKAAQEIRRVVPSVQIIVLSAYNLRDYVIGLLKAGAVGYVLKDDPSQSLIQAIRTVASGREWVSPRVSRLLLDAVRSENPVERLTRRETEVLRLIAIGRKNQEIANDLTISDQTVKNHITNIFRKLNAETRVEAILYAISSHLVSVEAIRIELGL